MSYRLWLPFLLGLIILAIGSVLATLLPTSKEQEEADSAENTALLADSPILGPHGEVEAKSLGVMQDAYAKSKALWRQLAGRRNFQLLILVFFIGSAASSNSALLPQYISKRYNWTFAHSGYLLSIKALVNITLLVIVVPTAVRILSSRPGYSAGQIGKLGSQVMLFISVIGVILVALAPSVPYLIFGIVDTP